MGLPITSDHSQAGCDPISSNCVIWNGPDIPCIKLCKGDSISDVTAKLAQELCDLLDQVDIDGFDLSCFNPVCPTLENFHELIQFIITKLCDLQACCDQASTDVGRPAGTDCPDCLVTIAQCFQYVNEVGDTVTQMTLADYARAIGTRVCSLAADINSIQIALSSQQTQINALITEVNNLPDPVVLPTYTSTCLTDKIPVVPPGGIPIADLVAALQEAFCELRTATGMPSELLQAILRECINLDTSPSLNLPGVNMGSLPGWILSGDYNTVADSINNMWITICDMRAAVQSIQDTCCPQGCDGLVVNLQVVFSNPTLTFFWDGDGTGFEDCNIGGSQVTITDTYGNYYVTFIPIVNYINSSYPLNLTGTPLNLASNLTVSVDACFNKISDGTNCQRIIQVNVTNTNPCPTLILDADTASISYQFNNSIIGSVTYGVNLYQGVTLIDTHVIVTNVVGPITGLFTTGVLPGLVYTVEITITVGGELTNTCPVGVITTPDLSCLAPTAVSATTIEV